VVAKLNYPMMSDDRKYCHWIHVTDEFIGLSGLLNNVGLFNASNRCEGPPASQHEWELLTVHQNKQKENGFTFGELMAFLGDNPNCCR